MSEDNSKPQRAFPISKILRYGGFGILLLMLILSLIYQSSNPNATDEERIEMTVQAGVNQGLTEVAVQTGTPNPTAIQATVDAGIDSTLSAIAASSATPSPSNSTSTDDNNTNAALDGVIGFFSAILAPLISIIQGMWNFAGIGGIVVQVLCCIVPPVLIVVGIVND